VEFIDLPSQPWVPLLLLSLLPCAVALGAGKPMLPTNVPPVKLFDELDYTLPALAKVKAAVDAGDTAAAKAALLAHFRARPDAQAKPVSKPGYDTHLADNLLKGVFIWGDTTCTYGPRIEDIEWYRVPKGVYWPLFDHQLGRHTFVNTLVDAYRNTGDEKYARHLVAMLLDFIRKCPVADGRRLPRINNADCQASSKIGVSGLHTQGHPAMMWSLMVAMRRVQRWPLVLQHCIHTKAMTPDALAAILTSIVEHQRYLTDANPHTLSGNHSTRTPTTALELAARFPEFVERDKWADAAIAELLRRYNWYGPTNHTGFVYPDGATVEICPDVAWGDYSTLLHAMTWIEKLGRTVPPQLTQIRERMIQHLAYVTWPNKFARNRRRPRAVPHLPGRGDLDYILSGGTQGTPPQHASYPMRTADPCYAGTYLLRSAWTPDAVALRVRFGPIQYKYSQFGLGDVGDVGVWGYGMHLVPHLHHHPRTGPFHVYGDRSFRGHGRSENTISVDGIGQGKVGRSRRTEKPLANPWVTTPAFDYVRGAYRFDHRKVKVTHTRAILFVKPHYFVVLDRLDGDGKPHAYRMKYQLHHKLAAKANGTQVVGSKGGQPRIVVAPSRSDLTLDIATGRDEEPREGWHLHAADKAAPAPALIYTWEQATPVARVETVLCPIKPGAPADLKVTRAVAGNMVTLTITRGGHTDVVTWGEGDAVTLRRADGPAHSVMQELERGNPR